MISTTRAHYTNTAMDGKRREHTQPQQPQQPQIECPQAIHVRKTRHSSVSMRTNFIVILVGETNYKQNFGGAGREVPRLG